MKRSLLTLPRSALGLALLFGVAGCSPGSYEDVARPALVLTISEAGGFCSSVHVVDANGVVWTGGGCGDTSRSLEQTARRVSAADRAPLDDAMDEVLALSSDPECDLTSPSGRRYRFLRTLASGGADEVRQCEPGVPLAAARLAGQLEALGAGTADAGAAADGG